jgi:hypothetical protein
MATTQVDATLKVEGADGTSRPLSVTDLATAATGAASETTLAQVLAELGQKLEPADLALLASAAKQDAAKNVLDAISSALGTPIDTNTALTLLATIAANTGTETTTVQQLRLTADQVQLNTDQVEAKLDTLHTDLAHGTYAYAAGTAASTIDVPAGGRVKRVSVIAGASASATVTIAGGATITIPAGGSFDEQIPGDATTGGDVVIGGTVQAFYVAWVA